MNIIHYQRLFNRIGYVFNDRALLDLALTHRSCGSCNNERLEFLGDSILNFVIGDALYQQFPQAREGELSRLRAQLVKGETLADVAREFQLGEYLHLGGGELKSGGHRRDSILADAVEALIGGIYIDAGMQACKDCILAWYEQRLTSIEPLTVAKDPKTQLQEYLQARRAPLPRYEVTAITGEAHEQQFTVECAVSLLGKPTSAIAGNRRAAEKLSAMRALKKLQGK